MCFILFMMPEAMWGQWSEYHIYKGGERIGNILASRVVKGERAFYRMDSRSEFTLLWKQDVLTTMSAEYAMGRLIGCHSTVKVNGAVRDSSHMAHRSGILEGYIHKGKHLQLKDAHPWTTARLYFEEPVGVAAIFVESELQDLPMTRIAEGVYKLTFTDRSENRYVYRNGVLEEIHVIRTFFDLLFKRT